MLPYLTTAVALVALLCSLYKEILAATKGAKIQPVIRAIRLHHVAQFAVVMLVLWAGIDADSKAKKIRLVQLDAAAAQVASQHSIPILDYYFLKLLPAASLLKNYDEYQEALDTMPTALQERNAWEKAATPHLIQERDAALEAFSGLQRIARSVLAESTMYGQRYPLKLVEWASRTLEIKTHDLPILLGTGEDGSAYAELTGLGIGSSITAARDAMTRLEK